MRPGFGLLSITNNGSSRGMAPGPLQRSGTNFLRWLRHLEYVHEMSREPGAVHRLIRAGKPIPVYGDGSTARDYSFVDDIVEGVVRSMTFSGAPSARINLGSDKPVFLRDMIAALEDALGQKAEIHRLPEQPGDVPQTWADLSNANQLLGELPRTPFDEGLKRFVQWFLEPRQRASA